MIVLAFLAGWWAASAWWAWVESLYEKPNRFAGPTEPDGTYVATDGLGNTTTYAGYWRTDGGP